MKTILKALFTTPAAFALLFVAPAMADLALSPSAVKLKAADIQQKIVGNTVVGDGWQEYYAPGGVMYGKRNQSAREYRGSWSLSGDQMCFHYPKKPQSDSCLGIAIDGTSVYFLLDNGNPDGDPAATLRPGNPEDFGS